jgi:hypothetical protein
MTTTREALMLLKYFATGEFMASFGKGERLIQAYNGVFWTDWKTWRRVDARALAETQPTASTGGGNG